MIIGIICLIIIIPIVLLISFYNASNFQNLDIELKFNKYNAFQHISKQINLNLTHYRTPGTQGREDCADYFILEYQKIGANFTYFLHNYTIGSIDCQNILFKMNPNYSNILILGAHYDSRAKATKDSVNTSLPVPGANDGASGSAILIELANVLNDRKNELSVQIWFLFFDAEDQGYDLNPGIPGWDWCEGSDMFVKDINNFYNNSKEKFDAMILLDMVGGTNLQFINEQRSTSSLLDELFQTGRKLGFTNEFPLNPITATVFDDHVSFINYDIPSADLIINFWNNPNWPYHHTNQDDLLHISNHSLEVTGKTVEQFIYNNYYNKTINRSQWINDINLLDTETTIIIIFFISIVGIISIIIYIREWQKDN